MSDYINLSKMDGSIDSVYDSGSMKIYEEIVCTEGGELFLSYFSTDSPMTGRDFVVATEISPNEPTEEQDNEFLYW